MTAALTVRDAREARQIARAYWKAVRAAFDAWTGDDWNAIPVEAREADYTFNHYFDPDDALPQGIDDLPTDDACDLAIDLLETDDGATWTQATAERTPRVTSAPLFDALERRPA